MTSPIFSNFAKSTNPLLVRTEENITAGITNIPLTKPAKIFFNCDNENDYYSALYLMEQYDLPVETRFTRVTGKYFIQTIEEIDSATIKQIWRNFKSYRPKFNSDWRYLFWELDNQEPKEFEIVLQTFRYLSLPVYVHKTMRGWHFLSVKPITKQIFRWAIQQLRHTNEDYPPITLRIKPNKYVNEQAIFNEGFIMSEKFHSDTKYLRDWIIAKDYDKIGQQYQLVWYRIDKVILK